MLRFVGFIIVMMGLAVSVLASSFRLPEWAALTVFAMAVLADELTTYACLRVGGQEGNPVIAYLFRKISVRGTFALMGVLWILFIVFRLAPATPGVQTAIAIAYLLVPVNNLIVYLKYSRRMARTQS